ncbi:helix-turn-helix domain-containing protein [Bosea vestrisii]|uniref:TetR/AcrR family transcriptional regulator n=1 Tax=Bosea vestrisii TaxID=151416 RepID=UPI0024E03108|nr:TetR/AcrR family transcriptional regulator [Bosea vestrisii]WID94727.1 helix-turn-helix domain-containing protein [Bosea vestrisii]
MSDRSESSIASGEDGKGRIEQIAEAALRLFARYGYKRTSMDDIAREAGVARATLYLHFKGKDDVFRAMLAGLGSQVETRCREALAAPGPFAQRLAALMAAHHGTAFIAFSAGEHLGELKAVMVSIAGAELVAFEAIFIDLARQLFEDAAAQGEIAIERSGLPLDTLIATIMRAAAGAKYGELPSCEDYLLRLREIAAVFAAAVTNDRALRA